MLTIGLTGGIACGKSTVARILSEAGIPVLDLDQLARVVVAPQSEGLAEIAARWPQVVREGVLDRKALGAVIMADPQAKKALEAITHPRIWMQMEAWLAACEAPVAVIEAALMVETGSYRRYDKLIVVSTTPERQLARLRIREGYSEAQSTQWLAAQLPLSEKERVADVVIRNDGRPEDLVAATWHAWTQLGLHRPV